MSVQANPEDLAKFAQVLNSFCENVMDEVDRLNGSFSSLSDSWRDAKQEEFSQILSELTLQLRQLQQFSNDNATYLLQQAGRLEDYLNA